MPTVGRKAPAETHVQSVRFKDDQWTEEEARSWCSENDFYTDGYEKSENEHRFRQYDPEDGRFRYRNGDAEGGRYLVYGYVLGSSKTMDPTQEIRAFCAVRDMGVTEVQADGRRLRGTAVVYNSESDSNGLAWFREVVRPGAFAKSIQEADIRALRDHLSWQLMGRTSAGTLGLVDTPEGIMIDNAVPNTSYARDLVESIERGDLNQMSFGFETIKERWTDERGSKPLREILEGRLFDVSYVTFPWYEDTKVELNMRARLAAIQEHLTSGTLSDSDRDLLAQMRTLVTETESNEPPEDRHSEGVQSAGEIQAKLAEARTLRRLGLAKL